MYAFGPHGTFTQKKVNNNVVIRGIFCRVALELHWFLRGMCSSKGVELVMFPLVRNVVNRSDVKSVGSHMGSTAEWYGEFLRITGAKKDKNAGVVAMVKFQERLHPIAVHLVGSTRATFSDGIKWCTSLITFNRRQRRHLSTTNVFAIGYYLFRVGRLIDIINTNKVLTELTELTELTGLIKLHETIVFDLWFKYKHIIPYRKLVGPEITYPELEELLNAFGNIPRDLVKIIWLYYGPVEIEDVLNKLVLL